MKSLILVEGWATTKESYKGKYRNEQGFGLSGFYRRDYKENHEMVVMSNGHSLCRYKYPRGINIPFHSPMVSWMNLTFCGGYGVLLENGEYAGSNMRLFETVANGLKPIGFIIVKINDLEEMIDKVKQSGLRYEISKIWTGDYEIGLANQGEVKKYFDLNKLVSSYRLYSDRIGYDLLTPKDEESLLEINELELAYFIKGFDYASSQKKNWEHVLTGLLLGFPIESTVALLIGQIY
ncbi:hypothetical protein [Bacillus tuaregi]|uniref:hypothetical protein n=1 Tax=Bacillus tuaregi TaxID=1816695 RepID=UPI0008F83730|nr:hypothetical protein [Bacillus tuaregi]